MHILVTGGAGFIGTHLVEFLLSQGQHVRVLDNFSSGRPKALEHIRPSIELMAGDIRDHATVQAAVRGVEVVVHLAAMVSVVESIETPLEAQAINVSGTHNVLDAARSAGVRCVVQASSCAVYGNTARLPVHETEQPMPLSPYAWTKLAAEQLGQLYSRLYSLETVSLRFFNVYGPRQDPASPYAAVVPRFIEAVRAGRQPVIYGDGMQSRDFVFVGDIVRALWAAATTPGLGGNVFNVGAGEEHSVLSLAHMVGNLLQIPIQPEFLPTRQGEVQRSCADTTLFTQSTHFRAQVDLRKGLAAMIGNC